MNALTVLDPQSPQARAIFHLAIVAGIIFACIFAIVSGMIVYALMRCRWREGESDPKQIAGNKTVLSAQIFLPSMADFAGMNAAWEAWVVPGQTPARATIEAKLANPAYKVEIMCVAAI